MNETNSPLKFQEAPTGFALTVHNWKKSLKTPTPISSQTASLLRILNSKGHEELDGIAILKLYDQKDTV